MIGTVVGVAGIADGVDSEAIAVVTDYSESGLADAVFIVAAGGAGIGVGADGGGMGRVVDAGHGAGFRDYDRGTDRLRRSERLIGC